MVCEEQGDRGKQGMLRYRRESDRSSESLKMPLPWVEADRKEKEIDDIFYSIIDTISPSSMYKTGPNECPMI